MLCSDRRVSLAASIFSFNIRRVVVTVVTDVYFIEESINIKYLRRFSYKKPESH